MRPPFFFIGVVGCSVSVVVLFFRLLALRSQPMGPKRREAAELREICACGALGMFSGALMVPTMWFLLLPFGVVLARRAVRWHRAATSTDEEPEGL